MSLVENVVVRCPECGRENTAEVWSSINVTVDPHLRDALFDYKLNVLECACGCEIELAHDLLYHDMDRRFQIWLKYPDERGGITVEGPVVQLAEVLSGYRLRIVRSFPELAEKITIFESGLDDRCIEILKALLDSQFGTEARDRMDLFFAGIAENGPDQRTLVFLDRAAGDADNPVTVKHEAYDDIAARLDSDSDRNQWRFVGETYGSKAAQQFIGPAPELGYKVFVDDNFHFMDEDERQLVGEFETSQAAVEECKKIVDESLASLYEPGMDADKLFEMYKAFGEDPFVRGPGERGGFYAWDYARERSAEICDERRGRIPTAEMKEAGSRAQASAKVGSERVWMQTVRLLGLLVGCWAMSVLVVTLGYLQWQDLEIPWGLANRYVDVWPLAGGFGAMSLYAVALPAAVGFLSRKGAELTNRVSGTHAVLGWILLIWSYPGTEQLGRHSDPRAFLVLGLVWMVQLATSLMAVRILKPKRRTREIWT